MCVHYLVNECIPPMNQIYCMIYQLVQWLHLLYPFEDPPSQCNSFLLSTETVDIDFYDSTSPQDMTQQYKSRIEVIDSSSHAEYQSSSEEYVPSQQDINNSDSNSSLVSEYSSSDGYEVVMSRPKNTWLVLLCHILWWCRIIEVYIYCLSRKLAIFIWGWTALKYMIGG
jgi:hypothetical protein